MQALTISEPFASLIVHGRSWQSERAPKWCENRTWRTNHRGPFPLAIHAGKGSRYVGAKDMREHFGQTRGRIIATCTVAGFVRRDWSLEQLTRYLEKSSWRPPDMPDTNPGARAALLTNHAHFEGPWAWLLMNVEPLDEPIEAVGRQGLWDFPDLWVS